MRLATIAVLLLAMPAWADDSLIRIPASAKGEVGDFIQIKAETNCKVVKWVILDAGGLSVFPMDLLRDSRTAVVVGKAAGKFRVLAYTATGDVPSEPSICTVTVGSPSPEPSPQPPGPGPTPVPPNPNPAKELRVVFVYESKDALTAEQMAALYSPTVTAYLNAKCVKDGNQPGWRRWDKDVSLVNEPDVWKRIWAATKPNVKNVPAVVIVDGEKGTVFPWPENKDELLKLLKQHGGE